MRELRLVLLALLVAFLLFTRSHASPEGEKARGLALAPIGAEQAEGAALRAVQSLRGETTRCASELLSFQRFRAAGSQLPPPDRPEPPRQDRPRRAAPRVHRGRLRSRARRRDRQGCLVLLERSAARVIVDDLGRGALRERVRSAARACSGRPWRSRASQIGRRAACIMPEHLPRPHAGSARRPSSSRTWTGPSTPTRRARGAQRAAPPPRWRSLLPVPAS